VVDVHAGAIPVQYRTHTGGRIDGRRLGAIGTMQCHALCTSAVPSARALPLFRTPPGSGTAWALRVQGASRTQSGRCVFAHAPDGRALAGMCIIAPGGHARRRPDGASTPGAPDSHRRDVAATIPQEGD